MLKNMLALFIAAMLLLGCIGSSGTKYESSANGFSTIQPTGWSAEEDGSKTVFYPGANGVQIAIVPLQSDANIAPEDILSKLASGVEQTIAVLPAITNLQKTSDNYTTLTIAGQSANQKTIAYEYTSNGTRATSYNRLVFFKKDSRYFILVFAADIVDDPQSDAARAAYEKAFDDVLANFRTI